MADINDKTLYFRSLGHIFFFLELVKVPLTKKKSINQLKSKIIFHIFGILLHAVLKKLEFDR